MLTAAHAHGDEEVTANHTWRHKTEHGTFMSEETMELMKSMMRIVNILPVKVRKNAEINGFYPKLWFQGREVGPQLKLLKSIPKRVKIALEQMLAFIPWHQC
jgi:imidazolonepropionase-like amidohydrolase